MHFAFNVQQFEISGGKIVLIGNFAGDAPTQKTLEVDQASQSWAIQNRTWYRLIWTDPQLQVAFAVRLALG